jgi:UDP-N-acetylglucosamine 4-epimerase
MAGDEGTNQVYNVAVNARTSLNVLHQYLVSTLAENAVSYSLTPSYRDFRAGDVRHSQADISKAQQLLGYQPTHTILQGLQAAMPWYLEFCAKSRSS